MGRKFSVITTAIALVALIPASSFAQGNKNGGRRGGGGGGKKFFNRSRNDVRHSKAFRGGTHERVLKLSPEERQTFKRNAERWLQMNPEQRKVLREREKIRRARMKSEAETALRESGLHLDPNAQSRFEARYLQERRTIEKSLIKEIEAKRQQQLPQLKQRLRNEFQSHQASPGVSATP